jgi:pyruvate formate lyase activating enzyme
MTDALPPIKGFLPSSLIEWEGKVACTLFLPGCNFRCPFCHASHLVLAPEKLETVPLEPILQHLQSNRGWIDGAVLSGGEPTLHDGLIPLIAELRRLVPAIKLDTNGSLPDVVERLIREGHVDFVAMDVKGPLEAYERFAGVPVDCEAIAASIRLLRESGVGHEFRTTVVPGLHTPGDILGIARLLGPDERLVLQLFAPLNCLDRALDERAPMSRAELRTLARAAAEFLTDCTVRGEPSLKLSLAGEGRSRG